MKRVLLLIIMILVVTGIVWSQSNLKIGEFLAISIRRAEVTLGDQRLAHLAAKTVFAALIFELKEDGMDSDYPIKYIEDKYLAFVDDQMPMVLYDMYNQNKNMGITTNEGVASMLALSYRKQEAQILAIMNMYDIYWDILR